MLAKEFINESIDKETFVGMFQKFLPLAMEILEIDHLPKMQFDKELKTGDQPSFGMYSNEENKLYVALANRHPVDILRTVAHELVHFKQDMLGELNDDSGRTGSPEENQAHEIAGIIMRHFNKQYPDYLKTKPVMLENFADGRNPQDKGDSKRYGVPTKASVSTLRKVAKQGGRKGQLAHWMANMKAGRAKKK